MELARVRLAGQPLLSSRVLAAGQVYWIACRGAPCIVHVFQDAALTAILRFPEDLVHLLLGSAYADEEMPGYLLATGQGGRVWCIPLSKNGSSFNARPTKRQKEVTTSSSSIVDDTDMYEVPSEDQELEAQASSQALQIKLKQLSVSTSSTAQNAMLTTVNLEWLLGLVPGASFATFGPEGWILVLTNSGSIYLLHIADGSSSCWRDSMNKIPSCALLLPSFETRSGAITSRLLSSSLLAAFDTTSSERQPNHLLLEACDDGRVYATSVDSLSRTMPSSAELFSLHEPVVAILLTQAPAGDVLLFIGQRGHVVALSATKEADGLDKSPSPFLYAKGVDVRKWTIKSPVTSACILGRHCLCYSAGSEVYVAHLLNSAPSVRLRASLEPCRAPVEDIVLRISGGAAGRDLVAFTARGRLLLVHTSDHLLQRPRVEEDVRSSWRPPRTRMEDRIQSLLQSISCTAAASESTMQDNSNAHTAVDEIASAMRLAFQVITNEQRPDGKRLHCTFDVSRQPSGLVPAAKLSFAASGRTRTPSFGSVPTRLSVTLHNQSGFCVSAYWSAVLEVRTVLGAKPVQQLSSVINRGVGLRVGEQCGVDFELDISEPATAALYLCHVNDFHDQLLVQSRDGAPQVPGAAGILLGRCRLDVVLQGEAQQVGAVDGMLEPVLVRDVPSFDAS